MKLIIKIAIALLLLTISSNTSNAFKITGIHTDKHKTTITHESDTNAYFITVSGDSPDNLKDKIAISMGEGGISIGQGTRSNARFYSVIRVDKSNPLDSDADGMDDIFEIENLSLPLVFNTTCDLPEYWLSGTIEDKREFYRTLNNRMKYYSDYDLRRIICTGIKLDDEDINRYIILTVGFEALAKSTGEPSRDLSDFFGLKQFLYNKIVKGIDSQEDTIDWWPALHSMDNFFYSYPGTKEIILSAHLAFPDPLQKKSKSESEITKSMSRDLSSNEGLTTCEQLVSKLSAHNWNIKVEDSLSCGGYNNSPQYIVKTFTVPELEECDCHVDFVVEGAVGRGSPANDGVSLNHWRVFSQSWITNVTRDLEPCQMDYKTAVARRTLYSGSIVTFSYYTYGIWSVRQNTPHKDAYADITSVSLADKSYGDTRVGTCVRKLGHSSAPDTILNIPIPQWMQKKITALIPDHHDVGAIRVCRGEIVEKNIRGFYAVNDGDALIEAQLKIIKPLLPKSYPSRLTDGWVPGFVKTVDDAYCRYQSVPLDKYNRVKNNILNANENRYSLFEYHCQHWAMEKMK